MQYMYVYVNVSLMLLLQYSDCYASDQGKANALGQKEAPSREVALQGVY